VLLKKNLNMKKQLLIISSLLGVALTQPACNKDFLDRPYQREIEDKTFWTNANDANLALNACYQQIDYGEWSIYDDGKTDNAHAQYPWESAATVISAGDVTSANNVDWSFESIRRVNNFLDKVQDVPMDADLKARFEAEARFLRAFRYANMMNQFGDVPIMTFLPDLTNWNVPRDKRADVLKFIIDELKAVAAVLPSSYGGSQYNEVGRITKGAAVALLARVYLYEGMWTEAAEAAQQVMGMNYDLFKVSEESASDAADDYSQWVDFANADEEKRFRLGLRSYEQQFWAKNNNNVEVILDRQYLEQKDPKYVNTYLLSDDLGGWSSVTPTQALVNDYMSFKTGKPVAALDPAVRAQRYENRESDPTFYDEYKNRDPRFYASILFEHAPWNTITQGYEFTWIPGGNNCSRTGYNFRKFVDPAAWQAGLDNYANHPIIRFAEVLLTYAEAKTAATAAGTQPEASVYDALDRIRVRAGMPVIDRAEYNTAAKLMPVIRQERRIELALEGQRYMDIRRWETAPNVMTTIYNISNGLAQTRAWSDKLYLMPIPLSETDKNPNLLPNNPDY